MAGAIGGLTILSGAVQLLFLERALTALGAEPTPQTKFLFAVVSVLTIAFGGALLHAVIRRESRSAAVLWAAVQKLAGAAVMGIGVGQGILTGVAGWAAAYDAVAGCLVMWYWRWSARAAL